MLAAKCQHCGKEFHFYPSDRRKYCSKKCANLTLGSKVKKHGLSGTRLHNIWSHMKSRCSCKTSPVYQYYGGRGIRVSNEWMSDFIKFHEWAIENGYSENLELDRIDVNGNYEASNCRWANRSQQMTNTRKRCNARTSRFKGVSWCSNVGKWRTQVQFKNVHYHVGVYTSEIEAAKAYDKKIVELAGQFTNTNFPRKESESS